MDRMKRIETIVHFVQAHPESLASRAISRRVGVREEYQSAEGAEALHQGLTSLDEDTLNGFYYMVT